MTDTAPKPEKKPKKRRTWKQRLKLTALIVIILVVVVRTGVNLLLPFVVRKVANAYDLDCGYDRMSLTVVSGNANIWGLTLRPKSGGDSIIRADFIHGSLSVPNLFRGRLVVYRAEVDGVDTLIDREPDGSIPLLKRFLTPPDASTPAPVKVVANPKDKPEAMNLQAPLRIDAVRLSHVSTTFRDRSVSPTFQTTIRTTFRLSDVGSLDQPAKMELQVDADPVLDSLVVQGVLHNTPTSIDADVNVQLRGLHPKPAAAYLVPLGLKPIADDITVKARAVVKINAIANTTDFGGQIAFTDIEALVNSAEWASLKAVTIDVKKANPTVLELATVSVDGGRASARRSDTGGVQIAGFELVPVAAVTAPPKQAAPVAAAATSPPPEFRALLEELKLTDLQATFADQAVRPATDLTARLDELSVKNILFDQSQPDATAAISGSASLPGVIKLISWQGTATPFAGTKKAALKVRAEGIQPTALKPYLDPLGVKSEFVNGVATADLAASLGDKTDAQVTNIKLADNGSVLLELPSAAVKGFSVAADGPIRVESIEVAGPTVSFRREADGSLAGVGIRVSAATTQPAAPTAVAVKPTTQPIAKAATTRPAERLALPRIQIDRYTWKDIHLNFEDRQGPAGPVALKGAAGVELTDFVLDTAPNRPAGKPGRFNAWLEAPGVAERLSINGTLDPADRGLGVTATFAGQGITAQAIASYLKMAGIEPKLTNGQVQGSLAATVNTTDDGLTAKLDVTDVSYADGESELAGVDAFRVAGLEVKPGKIAVGSIQIVKPRARVTRNADGTLQAAGVRLLPPPPAPPAPLPVGPPPPPAPLKLAASPIALALKEFKLEDGALQLTDNAVSPAFTTAVRGSVTLANASLAATDPPATLEVIGSVEGIVQKATVNGTLALAPDAPGAKLKVAVDQINAEKIAAYLPPGVQSTLRDGRFAVAVDMAARNHAEGGVGASVDVRDLSFEDRAAGVTYAKVGAFTARLTRLDPVGQVIAIDEVSSAGVMVDVNRNADGTIDAMGFKVGGEAKPAAPAPAVPQVAAATQPATLPALAAGTTQPAIDVGALVADARRPLPLLTVRKIDLKLDRLRVTGLAGADGKPVDLANVSLYNPLPIELAGPNADQRPPLKLQIDGGISPVVRNFAVAIESAPFAGEPTLDVNVTAGGIDGKGLTDIVPQLATTIKGDGLTEGTFNTHLAVSLNYGRRGPRDLDLGRGFVALFTLKPLEFRGQPDGPVLAGVEEVRGEGIKVDPKKGDVIIKSIDVSKPIGRFVRDEQGIHALGFVIPLKPAEPTTQPATQPAEVAEAKPAPKAPAPPPERPKSEFRLDRFTVTGVDLIVEDRTTPPTTIIPLKTLDLEVRGLSNQMAWTGKPLQFDMLCTADRVPLPPRKGASVTGPATQTSEGEGEMRELFSQVTANGRIGLKINSEGQVIPIGWAKTSVNGFELLAVRGPAKAFDVTIGGGVFDDRNDIRFTENGMIETRNRIVFTNLSMSEPANGRLQQMLKIPVPLDLGINAVTDRDGSITMDVPVQVESNKVDTGAVILPAIAAVGQIMVVGITNAPLKAIDSVGSAFGLGPGEKKPDPPVLLTFLTGVATLEAKQQSQIAELAKKLKDDKELEAQLRHELSPADVEQLKRRANPATDDVQLITARLRRDKAELLARRNALAAQARAQYAAQSFSADWTVQAVQAADRQLAQIDESLDQFYELLKPGAANQADRRTRAACLSVAAERFDLIQAALTAAGVPDVATRVRKTNPQFEPTGDRGTVTIILVPKKK